MNVHSAPRQKSLHFLDPALFTPQFAWKRTGDGTGTRYVYCESVDLSRIAAAHGTPSYCYSRRAIISAFDEFDHGLSKVPHTICFAVKSNGNLSILNELARRGSGFDIVSGGELEHLGRLGVRGNRIVFSGVGKTREEIRFALQYAPDSHANRHARRGDTGILLFNVESEAELDVLLSESARNRKRGGRPPDAAIRVNPDVSAGGHPHISTGSHTHKFGLDWPEARRLYLKHKASPFLRWNGISSHIGSQIVSLSPFDRAFRRIATYVHELRQSGITLGYLDIGGGLGVRYTTEKTPARSDFARLLSQFVRPLGMHLLLEPGRSIIARAGVLLTRVIYTKTNRGKKFVVVDAAMNDLLRPALYAAIHPITKVTMRRGDSSSHREAVDIVGPVCETGDCLLHDWPLGEVEPGDLLAIWSAGAYGMSQSSNYNARTRPAEVLVEGARFKLIRRRETQNDLLRTDTLAAQRR
ncbi:MAG TPA: diaminopimelate decarboxylase [Candidatus Acidoferrum sp.]|nr:diaminopimelate decarboxylase [Candidatus Acidoferrum sp.]